MSAMICASVTRDVDALFGLRVIFATAVLDLRDMSFPSFIEARHCVIDELTLHDGFDDVYRTDSERISIRRVITSFHRSFLFLMFQIPVLLMSFGRSRFVAKSYVITLHSVRALSLRCYVIT